MEKTGGWIKSKAAFRCLHASRLNEDQSRARSSKQDDWPRVGLGYGRGAHDKNGATRRRGWPLLFSHKCRVCGCTPPNRPPRFTLPKNTVHLTPPPLLLVCHSSSCIAASPSPLDAATLSRDWEARISRFNPRPGVIMRQSRNRWMAREWFRDCQRARRRQIERFSRVSWLVAWHPRTSFVRRIGCVMTLDSRNFWTNSDDWFWFWFRCIVFDFRNN